MFVLTHQPRDPWPRTGGTTYHFVTEGIERALQLAREAAGGRDIRISGGADAIRQYLLAGHVQELLIQVAPLLLGRGVRLFDGRERDAIRLQPLDATRSPYVTHLRYAVTSAR